jgi:orotidine-5'-phosphate decarboxylase
MQEHGASQGKSLAADLLPQLQGILQKEGLRDSCGLVLGATRLKDLSAELLQQAQEFPLLIPGFGEQQGSCSPEVTQQLLSRGSPHLVPLSRSLTGIGSRQWQETLAELSLKEYFSWYESHLSAVVKAPQYGALSCG